MESILLITSYLLAPYPANAQVKIKSIGLWEVFQANFFHSTKN